MICPNKFQPGATNNEILDIDEDTFISYAPKPLLGEDEETAIVYKNNVFLILNGDWREEYLKNMKNPIKVFLKNMDQHMSFWSDTYEDYRNAISEG
jgi:hypothetical protein